MFRRILLIASLSVPACPALAQAQDPVAQILANFDQIDANGDGVISRPEFRNVQAARWSQIDRNGDGYLSEDDFPRWAARRVKTQLAEIRYLDANSDGRISRVEFVNEPAPVFRRADRNADDVLTRSELEAAAAG